jgi:5'-deoxynucleotidase YfbR-like HD superfamily hydrolase
MFMREAFKVRRFHTVPFMAVPENVGEHTANMLMTIYFLYDDKPPLSVVTAVLYHDAPELVTGDIPAPTKWMAPEFNTVIEALEEKIVKDMGFPVEKLPEFDDALVKFADIMDLNFKCVEEVAVGNQIVFEMLMRGIVHANNLLRGPLKTHKRAMDLFKVLASNPYVNIPEFEESPQGVKH